MNNVLYSKQIASCKVLAWVVEFIRCQCVRSSGSFWQFKSTHCQCQSAATQSHHSFSQPMFRDRKCKEASRQTLKGPHCPKPPCCGSVSVSPLFSVHDYLTLDTITFTYLNICWGWFMLNQSDRFTSCKHAWVKWVYKCVVFILLDVLVSACLGICACNGKK